MCKHFSSLYKLADPKDGPVNLNLIKIYSTVLNASVPYGRNC